MSAADPTIAERSKRHRAKQLSLRTAQAKRVEELEAALRWALPLAERAMDDHRLERCRCGHGDITGTYKNGVTWAGIYQSEVDQIETARQALEGSAKP